MKKIIFAVWLLCFCSTLFNHAGVSQKDTQSEKPSWTVQPKHGKEEYHKHSILVKFKKGVLKHHRTAVAKLVNGKYQDKNQDGIDDRYHRILDGRWVLIEFKEEQDVDLATKAISVLKEHRHVEHVEHNHKQYIVNTPNDPRYNELWGMKKIAAEKAWDIARGSSDIIVGVIDSGVDYNHQDLALNMWVNPNEIPNNGIDDEGNGYVDDVHGINAITGSGDPMDDNSHGTHCSGTIGAVGNNNIGVVGVNWAVKIAAMKFLNSRGIGHTSDAIACINYAIDLKRTWKQNLRVLSNSWGSYWYSQALHDAISAANNADILFAAAAGNNGRDTDRYPHYPSCFDVPNVMSVAATDQNDGLSSFSNYGAATVDLGAPGSNILSTVLNNSYAYKSGTSMATPHVSGAAALLLSMKSGLTVQDLKTNLMTNGDPVGALQGKTVSGKRLDVYNDISAVPLKLKYGQYVHIQNGYANWASYLDTCGNAFCAGNRYNVSTSSSPNRAGGSGTWEIISTSGKAVGSPVLVGDSVHLKNKYGPGSYLDTCGSSFCGGGNRFNVSTSSIPDRASGSGTWEIISASGKAVGSPVLTWDSVHLRNKYGHGPGFYLDTCGLASCGGNKYNVSASTNPDRGSGSGSGTWRFVEMY
jgi:subtilisin family serine protease